MPARSSISGRQASSKKKQLIVKLRSNRICQFLRDKQLRISKLPFSQSQMAFAAVIVKTKPAQLSVQEYIDVLQKSFRKRKELSEGNRQIEPAEYWKSMALRLQKENEAAKEKIREMEARGYERNGDEDVAESSRKPYAPHGDKFAVEGAEVSQVPGPASSETRSRSIHGRLYAMSNQMAQRQDSLDGLSKADIAASSVEEILGQSARLVDLIISALAYACVSLPLLETSDPMNLDALLKLYFNQIGSSFQSCFKALNSLCQNIAGRQKKDQLVMRLLKVVDISLTHIHSLAKEQAEYEFKENRNITQSIVTLQDEQLPEGVISEEYLVSFFLEKFLLGVLDSEWQPGQGGHRELLEGMRYYIIARTAHIMRKIMFPQFLSTSDEPKVVDISSIAILLESRHLLRLLHASLGKSSSKKEEIFNEVLGDGRTPLMDKGVRKLQATLARGCFPAADAKYFREACKPPPVFEDDVSAVQIPRMENTCFDWIGNMVMTLIGFDLIIPLGSDGLAKGVSE